MKITIPIGSIMWAKTPNTENYMPYRMRTLIQLWRVVNGQKTELLTARFSANGGVHGDNNHPTGSHMDLPLGRYCYVVYNISENQVPILQVIFRGDSTNTGSVWGCAKDINGYACCNKVESGEKKEIYFDVENFEGSQYYHLDCNAWFVNDGIEQNFSSRAIDTITDYGINPLRIGRPLNTETDGSSQKLNYIVVSNFLKAKSFELPNIKYFEGTNVLNPFYEPDDDVNTQNPIYNGTGTTPNPTNPTTQTRKRNRIIIGSLALLTLLAFGKNENTDRDNN